MMNKHLRNLAVLLGLFGVNAAIGVALCSATQNVQYAKGRPAPPQPEPDHGPTLPPDPWQPI